MGCAKSKTVDANCTGSVINPKDGCSGVVELTIPEDWTPDFKLKLHHSSHGPLIKLRTTIKGRPDIRPWEVEVPEGIGAGDKIKITLQGESAPRTATCEKA